MRSERIRFPGAFGHDLAARLDRPDDEPRLYALFAHCFTCTKDLKAVARISRALVDRGIGLLRFDFTGLGESEGEFAETNFSSNLEDLECAIAHMRSELAAPQLLVGHSLGGAAVLSVAGDCPEVRAVATLGAPSDTAHLRTTLLEAAPELSSSEEAEVRLAGRPFTIRRQLLEDLAESRVLAAVGRLRRPLLVLHSPADDVVPIDHARKIYEAAHHPKSFVSLDRADHLLLADPADAVYVAEVLAAWVGRYVDVAPMGDAAHAPPPLERGQVQVLGGSEGLDNQIRAGRHALVADEPAELGGRDTGPTPYDLLLAALGACTSMTLRLYADRKGWDLRAIDVRLQHDRVHAKDCAECEDKGKRLDRIRRQLRLEGDLDPEQRQRLLEIAERCPVHRTLTSETRIETAWADEG